MNRNQYVTKRQWFFDQSAKSDTGEYEVLRPQCPVGADSGDNQTQGSILSDSTENQRLIAATKLATYAGNPLVNEEEMYH